MFSGQRWHNQQSGPEVSSSPLGNPEVREQGNRTPTEPLGPGQTSHKKGTGQEGCQSQLSGPQSQLPPLLSLCFASQRETAYFPCS